MHRTSAKHRILGLPIAELDVRDPSHVKLPLPVDSIPIVGPLVSPLVGNGAGGGTHPSAYPSPQSAPTSTAGSGSSAGDSAGDSAENGGGSPPSPTAPPTGGGGNADPLVPIVPSPSSPNSNPGKPFSSSSVKNASSSGSTASPLNPGGGGNMGVANGGQTVPVNVGTEPSITSVSLGASTFVALATGFSSPLQYSQGSSSNIVGTSASLPTNSTAGAVSSGKHLSQGAIAGITIVCLFFLLALVLLVVRRHSVARRVELRRRWWFSRSASGYDFSFVNSRSPVGLTREVPASRLSSRSSFATNFDQGLMFRVDSPSRFSLGPVPDLPPMAEVRERNSILISTGSSVARRESMNSMLSNGSDPGAQYLTVPIGQSNLEPSTPMSVRPFSPSESFAFPKPPAPPSSVVDSFFVSGAPGFTSSQSSATTLVHLSTPPHAFMSDFPPASVSTSLYPQTSTPSVMISPFIALANPSMDRFTDPVKPEFLDIEVIRRPFTPSLDDELAVRPGDRVRIFQIFDDGWAFVEELTGTECRKRGLIPVDCFREVDQALPTFLAEKRVSYGSEQPIAIAL